MKTVSTRAIVIQTLPIREADTLAVLLSKDLGRVSAFARNARNSRKRFMGGLDLFDCGEFELSPSRGTSGAYTVEQISNREHWPVLRDDLRKYSSGCYCLELTAQFAQDEDEDSTQLFAPLFHSLRAINSSTTDSEARTLALFYNLHLLKISGFNYLDDRSRLKDDSTMHQWLSEMLESSRPIVPYDDALLRQGFFGILTFTQEITGKELRSAAAMY